MKPTQETRPEQQSGPTESSSTDGSQQGQTPEQQTQQEQTRRHVGLAPFVHRATERARETSQRALGLVEAHPVLAAGTAAAAFFGLACAVGAAEVAVAAGGGYAAYRLIKRHRAMAEGETRGPTQTAGVSG